MKVLVSSSTSVMAGILVLLAAPLSAGEESLEQAISWIRGALEQHEGHVRIERNVHTPEVLGMRGVHPSEALRYRNRGEGPVLKNQAKRTRMDCWTRSDGSARFEIGPTIVTATDEAGNLVSQHARSGSVARRGLDGTIEVCQEQPARNMISGEVASLTPHQFRKLTPEAISRESNDPQFTYSREFLLNYRLTPLDSFLGQVAGHFEAQPIEYSDSGAILRMEWPANNARLEMRFELEGDRMVPVEFLQRKDGDLAHFQSWKYEVVDSAPRLIRTGSTYPTRGGRAEISEVISYDSHEPTDEEWNRLEPILEDQRRDFEQALESQFQNFRNRQGEANQM